MGWVRVGCQRLAVLRDDRGERDALSAGLGDSLDGARDLALHHARTAHPHGGGVHGVADAEGALHLFELLGALALAHLGHGEHDLHRLVVVQQGGGDAQQRRKLQLGLAAVRGQVVDRPPGAAQMVSSTVKSSPKSASSPESASISPATEGTFSPK